MHGIYWQEANNCKTIINLGGVKKRMPELQLKVVNKSENGVLGKALNNFNKVLYSSGGGFFNLYLNSKRNTVIKCYLNSEDVSKMGNEAKVKSITEKYEKAYQNYLNTLEKYITDTIYTKAQKRVSNPHENAILSEYYEVNSLKGIDYSEYQYGMQLMLLKMDWNSVLATKTEGFVVKFKKFYVPVASGLYKSAMRHYAIQITNAGLEKDKVFQKIYHLTEDYIVNFMPYVNQTEEIQNIVLAHKDFLNKMDSFVRKDLNDLKRNLKMLEFTREIFNYSLPTVAAEECYQNIIEKCRNAIMNTYITADKFEVYMLLLDAIESYYSNILSQKTIWDNEEEKTCFTEIWDKFTEYKKLANIDFDEYKRLREVLFITQEIKTLKKSNKDYSAAIAYFRERMKQQRGLRYFKNSVKKLPGRWKTRRRQAAD